MAREDGYVAFEAPTGAFMLRARVSQAVADAGMQDAVPPLE